MEKEKLNSQIHLRCSRQEKNQIRMLAELYADGNMSAYIIDRVLYSNRKFLKDGDFELSTRRIKREDAPKQD